MSVARCRFWKAIFFALLDQLLLPFISFFDAYTGILYNAVENSMQLQGIRYFVACRNTTLNRFVFITIISDPISPASMKTYLSYKLSVKNLSYKIENEINNPREDCLIPN